MKNRYNTIDVISIVKELKEFIGLRVINVYDIDNKTYLIKMSRADKKAVILFESAVRIHATEFDWPKNPAPSGFSMKLRKHINGRRLEKIEQLGVDRIVDLQFGSGEASYHVVVELYDRGNVVLTDCNYEILNILRPRTDDSQDTKFAVREKYPLHSARQPDILSKDTLVDAIKSTSEQQGVVLKKLLMTHLPYGAALIDHCLLGVGLKDIMKITDSFLISEDMNLLMTAVKEADEIFNNFFSDDSKGFIIQKSEKKVAKNQQDVKELLMYNEYHPYLFRQHENMPYIELSSFSQAVDEFYSKLEGHKFDMKVLQQEKAALKKLENVRKDHKKRIDDLQKEQEVDIWKGELIEMNRQLVDNAIMIVRGALANQIDWSEIRDLVRDAQAERDPVACAIKDLKLETNHITLSLRCLYEESSHVKSTLVDIDLALGAHANSRNYFDKKKMAAKKEQKTIESSVKALKSAEKKTNQTLKEAAVAASIHKTRKTYWFEKFLWFISSENYLVISGRDQQQNEIIVKRYLKPGDIYVHADLHGAASVIIKNPSGDEIPPKTLNEAGTMAICYSAAWDAKVITSAWYVRHNQVSKTAPTGEYLSTGSFMIRGKKNYLPPSYLVYGFALLFKLEDGSIGRHIGDRRTKTVVDDDHSLVDSNQESFVEDDSLSEDDNKEEDNDDDNKDNDDESITKDVADLAQTYNENDSEKGLQKLAAPTGNDDDNFSSVTETIDNESAALHGPSLNDVHTNDDNEDDGADDEHGRGTDSTSLAFPDTSITLQHVSGTVFKLHGQNVPSIEEFEKKINDNSLSSTNKKRISAKQRRDMKKVNKETLPENTEDADMTLYSFSLSGDSESISRLSPKDDKPEPLTQIPLNRGQRRKMKKIKKKYADEDEEDRQLRMELLASHGSQKQKKKKKENVEVKKSGNNPKSKLKSGLEGVVLYDENLPVETTAEDVDEDDPDKIEEEVVKEDVVLDSLTGAPHEDDELLFAVPVCAPYQSLNNYKFKVKLVPGNTKKGKATKTALAVFLKDRSASGREKDLMKVLKDVDLARNIPGKVKVATPVLQKS